MEINDEEVSSTDADSAYENGLIDGKASGYEEGFTDGYNAGFMDGAEAGYADGYADREAGY